MVRSRALVYDETRTATVRSVEVADPQAGEVRVRIVASGVCSTDHHVVIGTSHPPRLPVVLGHEGAGIVDLVGPGVTELAPGDHVVFARSAPCGSCRECRRGFVVDCDSPASRAGLLGILADGRTRVTVDGREAYPLYGGTLSEYMTVRADYVVRIDRDLPLDLMCLAGCAVVTGVGAVLNVAGVGVDDVVLVVGCGGVGLNVIQAARIAGATTIIGVDIAVDKLTLARRLGATHTIDSGRLANPVAELPDAVASVCGGGVDVAFEVVGDVDLVRACVSSTRVGGTTVMVGVPPAGADVTVPAFPLLLNRRLVGCRGGSVLPQRDLDRIVRLHRTGVLDLGPLVGARIPLERVGDAFAALEHGAIGRFVVQLGPSEAL